MKNFLELAGLVFPILLVGLSAAGLGLVAVDLAVGSLGSCQRPVGVGKGGRRRGH